MASVTCAAPTYPPPSSSVMVAVAHLLSKGAVTGIVIGVFAGVGIVLLVMAITWGVLRRRGAYQVGWKRQWHVCC